MEASRATTVQAPLAQVLSDYFTLTKPKVQLLLLLTTITTMYVAGEPSVPLVAATVLGGFLSAGGAGAFILGLGILLTILNVARGAKRGVVAGPDPWKANTLEWFTTSPPPVNNFDVVPRVRSVEPMKDIRRQAEEQSGSPQRFEAGRPMVAR